MLRLSRMTDYATVILSYMGREPGGVFSAADLAAALGYSPPTVSKVLKALLKRRLVCSRRGSKGGYLLARPPHDISIAEIAEALEGPLGLTECAIATGRCAKEDDCRIRANWLRINRVVLRSLEEVTLSDMGASLPASFDAATRHSHGNADIDPR